MKNDLLFYGNIIQDDDNSVSQDEKERRFNRYIELLDNIQGKEGVEIIHTIIQSIQVKQDYGAYQSTIETLMWKFSPREYISVLIQELPDLAKRCSDWAGELLNGIANQKETEYKEYISIFNKELAYTNKETRKEIMNFIYNEEKPDGWLRNSVGLLRPQE